MNELHYMYVILTAKCTSKPACTLRGKRAGNYFVKNAASNSNNNEDKQSAVNLNYPALIIYIDPI